MKQNGEVPLPDAALELGVSWGVAWRFALRGELEARKVGNRWVVTRESVERKRRALSSEPVPA
jgi:hypothetical protein